MKKLWIFALLLYASVTTAQAQTLALRSGDHTTFSRITLPLSADQTWNARRTDQGVELTLPGHSGGFDQTDVFLRMKRNRIGEIVTGSDGLTLRVVCDCDATAFRSGPLLVIDVADKGTNLAGPSLGGRTFSAVQRPPTAQRDIFVPSVTLPWIGGESPFGSPPPIEATSDISTQAANAQAAIEERAALLNEVQQSLVARIADAASIGLLENSYETPETIMRPRLETMDPAPEPVVNKAPEMILSTAQNLRITSSMDLPGQAGSQSINATTAGMTCPEQGLLSVETWGNETSFSAQIGPARNALMNARDKLDPAAAKTLAQLFIFFGFGAEALDTLKLDPALSEAHPHLMDIAAILEFGAVKGRSSIGSYTDCASDVALWASLSFRDIPSGIQIDSQATLRALNKLPQHLRQIVAPQLSARLLQYGDPAAAAAAMRSIERLPEPLAPDAVMAQAGLAIDAGKPAEAFLKDVIKANSSESPAALVKLVEGKLARNEPLSYETATLIEAYVQELRGTEMGNQLRRTQILALSQSEHFEEAFAALGALAPSLSSQATAKLRQAVLERLAGRAEDIVFLEHLFAQEKPALETLPRTTKISLASRLMDLGFAAQVQEMLEMIPDAPRESTRQLLAARAALALRQPFQAQAALIGIDAAEAQLLLAQAKEMAGAYSEASAIFRSSNEADQAARAAWLSEDWGELTTAQSPAVGALTTMVQTQPGETDSDLGPLGRANRILEESSAARNTLEQFLRDPLVQINPES